MVKINQINTNRSARSVSKIINSVRTVEGEGFVVNRPFPTHFLSDFDPFLLLDEMGPVDLAPGEAKGAPDHPHRGFETVTYMLDGKFEHRDSKGHAGKLGPGDVQWMTAGSGVVHSEMPEKEFTRTGGRMHGFQLWVNLPGKYKMVQPQYQEIPSSRIPVAKTDDGKVSARIIAGQALGSKAVIDTVTPIIYLHFTMQPGSSVSQTVPRNYSAFAYVVSGAAKFGDKTVERGRMVIFENDSDEVSIAAESMLDVLLIAGVPIKEPIARYGPFVMNTKEEIYQAIEDYRTGKMGKIN
jgi:hypothetical protein